MHSAFAIILNIGEWMCNNLQSEFRNGCSNSQINSYISFQSQNNGLFQRQPSGPMANYGTVETPLPASQPPAPHPMQPEAPGFKYQPTDPYQVAPEQAPVVPSGNPFRSSSNPFRQEAVQPIAQDRYLHGTVEDRTY